MRLSANEPGVTFHLQTRSAAAVGTWGMRPGITVAGYDVICTAPCEATLPAGAHTLALSEAGGSPVAVRDPVQIDGPASLYASFESNAGLRATGWTLVIASALVGSLLPIMFGPEPGEPLDTTKLYVGLGILSGGMLLGLPLAFYGDDASISVQSGR